MLDEHFGIAGSVLDVAGALEFPAVDCEVRDDVHSGSANEVPLMEIAMVKQVEGFLGFVDEHGTRGIEPVGRCVRENLKRREEVPEKGRM